MRILIVDDEAPVLRLVQRTLERDGHLVHALVDPADVLEELKTHTYDVALVDLSLPGIRGDELIRQMNTFMPNLPVVLMTGYAVERPLPGTALVLSKPFSIQNLRDTIAIFDRPPHTTG